MNLTGIVSVTGKPGLYKVIGQNKSGFILETLDEARNKQLINPNTRIAALKEITIYGVGEDLRLRDIFEEMKQQAESLPVPQPKSDSQALKDYFAAVAPEHDEDRVYVSDIKKIVSWYGIISGLPLFNEADEEEGAGEEGSTQETQKEKAGAENEGTESKKESAEAEEAAEGDAEKSAGEKSRQEEKE